MWHLTWTLTAQVAKLQRASLHDPVKVEVSTKYQTVASLQQYYLFMPAKFKVIVRHFVVIYVKLLSCYGFSFFTNK